MTWDRELAEVQLHRARADWEAQRDAMLQRLEDTFHWQQCSETYDQQVREYYSVRASHQADVVRLNQVLYGYGAIDAASQSRAQPEQQQCQAVQPARASCGQARSQPAPMAISPPRPPLQQRLACNTAAAGEPMALCAAFGRKRSHEVCFEDCVPDQSLGHTKRAHY